MIGCAAFFKLTSIVIALQGGGKVSLRGILTTVLKGYSHIRPKPLILYCATMVLLEVRNCLDMKFCQ